MVNITTKITNWRLFKNLLFGRSLHRNHPNNSLVLWCHFQLRNQWCVHRWATILKMMIMMDFRLDMNLTRYNELSTNKLKSLYNYFSTASLPYVVKNHIRIFVAGININVIEFKKNICRSDREQVTHINPNGSWINKEKMKNYKEWFSI